jgi:quinol monooxygenase YgiN
VDEAIELLKAVTKVAQESPGILYFCIAQDDTDPTIFYGHERYTGRQAFEKHQGNETVTKFFKSGLVLDAKPKVLKQIQ